MLTTEGTDVLIENLRHIENPNVAAGLVERLRELRDVKPVREVYLGIGGSLDEGFKLYGHLVLESNFEGDGLYRFLVGNGFNVEEESVKGEIYKSPNINASIKFSNSRYLDHGLLDRPKVQIPSDYVEQLKGKYLSEKPLFRETELKFTPNEKSPFDALQDRLLEIDFPIPNHLRPLHPDAYLVRDGTIDEYKLFEQVHCRHDIYSEHPLVYAITLSPLDQHRLPRSFDGLPDIQRLNLIDQWREYLQPIATLINVKL